MIQLVTAETFHLNPAEYGMGTASPAAWSLLWHSDHFKGKHAHDLPSQAAKNPKVTAFVSAGRWSIRCPWCPTSEYASYTDRRFMCAGCYNNQTLQWIPVTWPADDMVNALDTILMLRPTPNRNWVPGETLTDLLYENDEMGLPSWELLNQPRPTLSVDQYRYQQMMAKAESAQRAQRKARK